MSEALEKRMAVLEVELKTNISALQKDVHSMSEGMNKIASAMDKLVTLQVQHDTVVEKVAVLEQRGYRNSIEGECPAVRYTNQEVRSMNARLTGLEEGFNPIKDPLHKLVKIADNVIFKLTTTVIIVAVLYFGAKGAGF